MARATHLADTSAFGRFDHAGVRESALPLIASGQVALCGPVIYELGFSARNAADYDEIMMRTDAFDVVPTSDGDMGRALAVQRQLVRRGHHRAVSLVDMLVAAIAESRGLIILHYDADFDLIAEVTGQSAEWIVPRGSAD